MPRIDKIASGKRLRELRFHLRELLGVNEKEIAKLIGVHESTIRRYEEKDGVKKTVALALQAVFGANPDWLLYGKGEMFLRKPTREQVDTLLNQPQFVALKPIPVVRGQVPASFPKLNEEDIADYLYLPESISGDVMATKIRDESMSPTFEEGELIVFQLQPVDIRGGDIVVVKDEWNELLVRRYRLKGKNVYLVSDNPKYPSFTLKKHTIVGKVIKSVKIRDHSF